MSRAGELDRGPVDEIAAVLTACLAAPAWVHALVATRPHTDAAGWLTAADAAYATLPDGDVLAALAAHPRIGAAPSGRGAHAAASRREQARVSVAGDDVRAALAAGNRVYEERFGRVFLIRAAGRAPEEILGELHRRLANSAQAELAEGREQLRQITLLRLERVLAGDA
jgi:2-oxo-4-hydroxy-4-carboxy-5-ureidoimidazoline decarboxylase